MNKEFEEVKRVYKEIKRNKDIIGSIEKDFFFDFGDLVIKELENKDKIIDEMANFIAELKLAYLKKRKRWRIFTRISLLY